MKKLLAIIVLSLCFITPLQADDIKDFQVEGISVGDSLLDYYNKSQITSKTKGSYPGDDGFYGISFSVNSANYQKISPTLKKGDNEFIIYSIRGEKKMDYKNCLKKKEIVIKEIKEILTDVKIHNYVSNYKNKYGKSISNDTDLRVKKGTIKIYCNNWDDTITQTRGWHDSFNISADSDEFINWIRNKAYR